MTTTPMTANRPIPPGLSTTPPEPPRDCALCPRLADFRAEHQESEPSWFNGAVPSFGPETARLLIVGLAPGLQGANRTGRPFTGDYAGDLLYPTLLAFGFARGAYGGHPGDGLSLQDAMITNAVRCVPPQNKPTGAEIKACRPFLLARIEALPQLRAVIALGRIAHESVIAGFGLRQKAFRFAHAAVHELPRAEGQPPLRLTDSYHCSRYNTNTGRLTEEMFHAVFADTRRFLEAL